MKKQLLAALLAALLLLAGCQYSVVEDADEQRLVLGGVAQTEQPTAAETAAPLGVGNRDAEGETAITEMQQRLMSLNYLNGKADGIFGNKTAEALKRFQAMNSLPETGALDAQTAEALLDARAVPMPTPEPTPLARGAKGSDVKEIQEALRAYGFLATGADGDFGGRTDEALKLYQKYLYERDGLEYVSPTATPEPTPIPTPSPTPEPTLMSSGDPAEQATEEPTAQPTAEPTATPYAPDGIVSDELKDMLLGNRFEVYRAEMKRGLKDDDGIIGEIHRLQRRLQSLFYLDGKADGQFGGGTEAALKYFQKRNKLEETGMADEATQRVLFSREAVKSDRPQNMYMLKISIDDQRVYAYKWKNGSYSERVRTMKASTGTKQDPTPLGTFTGAGPAGRWYYFNKFDVWAQYAWRMQGPYLFHSVLYNEKNTSSLIEGSVYKLGSRASHGCIRLAVEDAKWIYNNCGAGTTVKVY